VIYNNRNSIIIGSAHKVCIGKIIYMIFRYYLVVFIDLEVKIAKRKLVFETEVNKIEEGIEIFICDLLKL